MYNAWLFSALSRHQFDSLKYSWSFACIINYEFMPSLPSRIVCSSILHFLQMCTWVHAILDNVHSLQECYIARSLDVQLNHFFSIFNPLHSGLSILKTFSIIFTKMEAGYFLSKTVLIYMISTRWETLKYMIFSIKMVSKALKLVLCYCSPHSAPNFKMASILMIGMHVSRQLCPTAQIDLNSQHIRTGSPKSEPNSINIVFFAI